VPRSLDKDPARATHVTPPLIRIEDFGTEMRLVVDQHVPWEKAIRILNVLKAHTDR
jgi:hypothetical protein